MNPKFVNAVADHAWLGLMAAHLAVAGLVPAFPHAHVAMGAVSDTLFQLAVLAASPMAAIKMKLVPPPAA